jgi:glycosyltransferase involved in cell wall biosynthesis
MGGLWPLNTGGRQRTFQILSELARRHEVQLLTTSGPGDDARGLARHLEHCEHVESVPYVVPKAGSPSFAGALAASWLSRYPVDLWKWRVAAVQRRVRELAATGRFDVAVADFLFAVPNMPESADMPLVFFAHNVEHLIWKRLSHVEPRLWRRALLEVEWRKVRRCEARACQQARITIAVSSEDRERLQADAPSSRVVEVPTGVDADYYRPEPGREVPGRLVFSGSMDWYPNEDAVVYFVDTILPRIRQRRPDVSMTIVGRNPGPRVRALADRPGVYVTGNVEEVRPFVAEGAVYVVPLRIGGGTRLKIFEALAMGKAVVSTSVGAEGLGLVSGRHLALADGPDAFSAAVGSLLADRERCRRLGHEGRRLVVERYSWGRVAGEFAAHLQEATRTNGIRWEPAERRARVS